MLLNLAAAAQATDKAVLWGFIRKYAPDASPETNPGLDAAAARAVAYVDDKILPNRLFRAPTEVERAALADLSARLKAWDAPADAEALQTMIYEVGKSHPFPALRDWFAAIYAVLLGAEQGPRFGGFVALYGVAETAAMIDGALGREG
jgi:lysyl-tRNA synthetase class 1